MKLKILKSLKALKS